MNVITAMIVTVGFALLFAGVRFLAMKDSSKGIGSASGPDDDPLAWTVDKLAQRDAEVIAADITTDEARQVGMHVVKVLVPEAMPLSFVHST